MIEFQDGEIKYLLGFFHVRLIEIPDGFTLREIFDDFKLYGERHRFIPVLAASKGWKVTEAVVNHRARTNGVSKYNWRRLPKGFLDLITITFITSFNERPQHMLGGIGLATFVLGFAGVSYMAIYWALRMTMFPEWLPVSQRPLLLYSVGAMLFGGRQKQQNYS